MRSSKPNFTAVPPHAPARNNAPRRWRRARWRGGSGRPPGLAGAAGRTVCLALACGALAGLVAGCDAGPPPIVAERDVVRPNLRLAIDVPDGWVWKNLGGDIVLEIVPRSAEADTAPATLDPTDPDDANAATPAARRYRERTRPVIHVAMIQREGLSEDAWADQAIAAGQELQPGLQVLVREPVTLGDGRPALALVLKNPRGLEPFVQQMRLVMTEARAYAVIATAPESAWPEAEAAVTACFDSFVVW